MQIKLPPDDTDCTSDLSQWFHCSNNKGLPDTVLSQAWDIAKSVSFVFHHRSAAAEVKPNDGHRNVDEEDADEEAKKTKKKSKFLDDDEYVNEEMDDPPDDESDEDFVL